MKKRTFNRGNRQVDTAVNDVIPNPAGIPGTNEDSEQVREAHFRWKKAARAISKKVSSPRYWKRHYGCATL